MGAITRAFANNILTGGKFDATDMTGTLPAATIGNPSMTNITDIPALTAVSTVTSDPPSPDAGQMWYNSSQNIGKLPLRKLLVKNEADSLISKEKLGFNVNTINLWKSTAHSKCKDFFDDSRIVKDGWINNECIQKYIDKDDLDIKYINKFLGLLAFEIWYRLFITKEMNSEEKLD